MWSFIMKLKSIILYSLTSLLIAYNAFAMEEEKDAGEAQTIDNLRRMSGVLLHSERSRHFLQVLGNHGVLAFEGMTPEEVIQYTTSALAGVARKDLVRDVTTLLTDRLARPAPASAVAAAPALQLTPVPMAPGASYAGAGAGVIPAVSDIDADLKKVIGVLTSNLPGETEFLKIAANRDLMAYDRMPVSEFFEYNPSLLSSSTKLSLLIELQNAAITARLARKEDFTPAQDILGLADKVRFSLLVDQVQALDALASAGVVQSSDLNVFSVNVAKFLQYATQEQRDQISQSVNGIMTIPETPQLLGLKNRLNGIWGNPAGYKALVDAINTMSPDFINFLEGARITFPHLWAMFGRTSPAGLSEALDALEARLAAPVAAPDAQGIPAETPARREQLRAEQDTAFQAVVAADAARLMADGEAAYVLPYGGGGGVGVAANTVDDGEPVDAAPRMTDADFIKRTTELLQEAKIRKQENRYAVMETLRLLKVESSAIGRLLNPSTRTADPILAAFSLANKSDAEKETQLKKRLMTGLLERADNPSDVLQFCYDIAQEALESFSR
jgi:hypothetical protein